MKKYSKQNMLFSFPNILLFFWYSSVEIKAMNLDERIIFYKFIINGFSFKSCKPLSKDFACFSGGNLTREPCKKKN